MRLKYLRFGANIEKGDGVAAAKGDRVISNELNLGAAQRESTTVATKFTIEFGSNTKIGQSYINLHIIHSLISPNTLAEVLSSS